jgi:hypothetical protein
MLRVLPALLAIALTIYAAVDCIQTDEAGVRNLPKLVWVFLVLLFPVAGPAAWFIAGRPTPPQILGGGRPRGTGPQAPKGPDDDPDFLRRL